jgi:glycogen debranching enzyme
MDTDFARIYEGLLDAASHSDSYRLPELFAGFSRTEFASPVPYPVACQPQAWAAGAIPYLAQAGLGLVPDGLHGRLCIRRPSLPRHVDRVDVRGLRIAGSSVDLVFERATGGHAVLADVHVEGDVVVSLEVRA